MKEVTRYLHIGIPSITGEFYATLPEEECWKIKVSVPGRTIAPVTEPLELAFEAPTWSLGKSMAAHITFDAYVKSTTRTLKTPSTRFVDVKTSNGRCFAPGRTDPLQLTSRRWTNIFAATKIRCAHLCRRPTW